MDLIALKTCSVRRSSIRVTSAFELASSDFFFACSFACDSIALPISFASNERLILVPHSHMMHIFDLSASEDTFAFFELLLFSNRINSIGLSQSLVKIYKFCELKQNCFLNTICATKSSRLDD
jgi:hypothetical protein